MSDEYKDYIILAHIRLEECNRELALDFMAGMEDQTLKFNGVVGRVEEVRPDGARHLREI